jgi:hypothetical protein
VTAHCDRFDTQRVRSGGPWLAAAVALAGLAAGCGSVPVYGPPGPGGAPASAPSAGAGLRQFRQAETGPFARAFQAEAATFNRDSRKPHADPAVLGEDAYQVSAALLAWSGALQAAPVPAGYQQAKAALLRGLTLLQQGYRHIGDGLVYGSPAELGQGRAQVQAGARMVGPLTPAVSV